MMIAMMTTRMTQQVVDNLSDTCNIDFKFLVLISSHYLLNNGLILVNYGKSGCIHYHD